MLLNFIRFYNSQENLVNPFFQVLKNTLLKNRNTKAILFNFN
jgi:hypothetical protein